jgi:two-component system CheB/CheR fusion protein
MFATLVSTVFVQSGAARYQIMKKPPKEPSKKYPAPEYIVGIGASAGGLLPINDFFEHLQDDTGMAYIVIQHLSSEHKSLMSELLARHTPMEVYEAQENMVVMRDCIYLIPNQNKMIIEGGRLKLLPKSTSKKPNDTIDVFFESLAKDRGKHAIGIILSGTGTDGTNGVAAIKKNGGIVIVQDPSTAEFNGMPLSAVAAGHADLVVPTEMIPSELQELLHDKATSAKGEDDDEGVVSNILTLVSNVAHHDFSLYKRPTIKRRLAKRMMETNHGSLHEYSTFLLSRPDELKILSREFLINVTKFFRDKEAFDILQNEVLPQLFKNKTTGDFIKVWSVACSSGEEAYSLAILFHEYMASHDKLDITVKVFATDIDDEMLELAMQGLYPATVLKEISRERKNTYFTEEGKNFRINPAIRKMVVITRHDVAKDAPFSKVDLLCCRNMLIYMNPILQRSVLESFHYAVKEKSYLWLGPSENVGHLKEDFEEISSKWKLYRCITRSKVLPRDRFDVPIVLERNALQPAINGRHRNALNHLAEIFQSTVEEDNYAGILIDPELTVKQASGSFKNFLSFPDSTFNFNLLKLVHVDLAMALSLAIRTAIKDQQRVIMKDVKVHEQDHVRTINIIVKPFLTQQHYMQPFLFVILQEIQPSDSILHGTDVPQTTEAAVTRIDELQRELQRTKDNLQSLVEQIENSNEELQSRNEEMAASHEELQSTNEELQSLNEELHTVNAEHQQKIKELHEANDDLVNYFNSSEVGQIFIDKRLLIRKFSPAIVKQINVKEIDLGRSIIDISNNFKNLDFINEIKKVMKSGERLEKEIVINTGRTFLMTINPYVRRDKKIDGVIITFADVSTMKSLNNFVETIFNTTPNAMTAMKAIRNNKGEISGFQYIAVNAEARRIFNARLGKNLDQRFVGGPHDFSRIFKDVVEQDKPIRLDFKHKESTKWYQMDASRLDDGVLATFNDITDRKAAEELREQSFKDLKKTSEELKDSNTRLQQSNLDLMQFASVASHDLKEPLRKILVYGDMLLNQVKERLDPKETEILDKITRSSSRMKVLIDDVLTLSKLSNRDIIFDTVDLKSLVQRICDDLEVTINDKQAEIMVDELPLITANIGQMNQLFQNLISNALKFNDKKVPRITIKESQITQSLRDQLSLPAARPYKGIEVIDNGIGFDNVYADKIFGIFQRLNPAGGFEGTGIGLAVCKKIVENHNGVIKADSMPGKGSRFLIALPA